MPMFKKSGGKIFAVQFNKAEERALDREIKKQIVENDRAFDMDKESSILWMLHMQIAMNRIIRHNTITTKPVIVE